MAGVTIRLPHGLEEQRALGPDWSDWLDDLPRRFADVLEDWELTRDGTDLWHGFCSLVAPVHTADGDTAVLKVSFDGDQESLHEGLALQHWHGDGVVRLLRADPHRRPRRVAGPCCPSAISIPPGVPMPPPSGCSSGTAW